MRRHLRNPVLALALAVLMPACAYNATGLAPPKVLIFEAQVAGEFVARSDIAYYFVIDTNGDPDDGPRINGGTPFTNPFPDARSYLPFVRDERAILDRQVQSVPNTAWTTFFALYPEIGGTEFVCWQGRANDDGTINERARQLNKGREWNIVNGKTWQLTLPFTLLRPPGAPDDFEDKSRWEANLAVAWKGAGRQASQIVIERWNQVPNLFFPITTTPVNQSIFDPIADLPVDLQINTPPGIQVANFNFVQINYRVIAEKSR